jgi:adenylylsulfate kinase
VLASVISPYAVTRDEVRGLHEREGADFLEVHVSAPVGVCRERDVKGLYARQRSGELRGLTGVDAPYEVPVAPAARIPTHEQTLEQSVDQLLALLRDRGLL